MGKVHDYFFKPIVPFIWLMKMGTGLTTTKMLMLNDEDFKLETHGENTSLNLELDGCI